MSPWVWLSVHGGPPHHLRRSVSPVTWAVSGVPVVREAKVVGLRSGPHWTFINAGFHAIKCVWVETKFAVTGHFLVITTMKRCQKTFSGAEVLKVWVHTVSSDSSGEPRV